MLTPDFTSVWGIMNMCLCVCMCVQVNHTSYLDKRWRTCHTFIHLQWIYLSFNIHSCRTTKRAIKTSGRRSFNRTHSSALILVEWAKTLLCCAFATLTCSFSVGSSILYAKARPTALTKLWKSNNKSFCDAFWITSQRKDWSFWFRLRFFLDFLPLYHVSFHENAH